MKTGRIPDGKLKAEVNRQLCMYRDILKANNVEFPEIITQGWYTKDASKWKASGEDVMEDALAAWEATLPTKVPLEPTVGEDSCGGFCDWKAWCPHWHKWRHENGSLHSGDFADAVIEVIEVNEQGSGFAALCIPEGEDGSVVRLIKKSLSHSKEEDLMPSRKHGKLSQMVLYLSAQSLPKVALGM